jgi:hypothetical protein
MAMFAAMLLLVGGMAPAVPALAQSSTSTGLRLDGLRVVTARRVTVEGKQGIEVNFDAESAKLLQQFTIGAIGRHATLFLNGRRLGTLRLLDPLTDGQILLSGDLNHATVDALFAPDAIIDLVAE